MEDRDFSKEDRDIVRSQTLEEYLHGKHDEHDARARRTRHALRSELIDYKNQGNG